METKYNDYPWQEVLDGAGEQIKLGHTVYQKWTCDHCGSRQSMETPNTFHELGICEECKKETNIKKRGHNYMLHMILRRP